MKFIRFSKEDDGKQALKEDIPANLLDDAKGWREVMLESLYSFSNELAELALEEKPIPPELIRKALREGCISMKIQPVLCGSLSMAWAFSHCWTVWDTTCQSTRSTAVVGVDPRNATSNLNANHPLKSLSVPWCSRSCGQTGDLSGSASTRAHLKQTRASTIPPRQKRDVAQLWQIHATKKERQGQVQQLECGDIACAIGPRLSITGDTLCDTREMIELPSIQFAQTVISMAIEPENATERKKLSEVLDMLKRQDPTFNAIENEESAQTLICGMGELHLDVIKHRLTRDFNLNVKFYKPRVNYRETISNRPKWLVNAIGRSARLRCLHASNCCSNRSKIARLVSLCSTKTLAKAPYR